jgi:citrate lyase subunit beta/citryl-CoA lyase
MTIRRSILAVPASSPRMMAKAATLDADEIFFDLEDAVAPAEKAQARALAVEALRADTGGRAAHAVRINDPSTPMFDEDLVEVVVAGAAHLTSVIVPKVETAAQVARIDAVLEQVEREGGHAVELEVQIETPLGVVNLREITQASGRLAAVTFGPGDFAAAMGIPATAIGVSDERYPGHQWHWVMAQIATHARAVGAQAIDGPWTDFNDEAGFRRSAALARMLGFDGKWCIHPNQIPWANEEFSPSVEEIAAAKAVVDAYARSVEAGEGAVAVDGKMIDEASSKMAVSVLERARAAGR